MMVEMAPARRNFGMSSQELLFFFISSPFFLELSPAAFLSSPPTAAAPSPVSPLVEQASDAVGCVMLANAGAPEPRKKPLLARLLCTSWSPLRDAEVPHLQPRPAGWRMAELKRETEKGALNKSRVASPSKSPVGAVRSGKYLWNVAAGGLG